MSNDNKDWISRVDTSAYNAIDEGVILQEKLLTDQSRIQTLKIEPEVMQELQIKLMAETNTEE